MPNTKLYLDKRSVKKNGEAPIKISITHNHKAAQLSTGISVKPEQWNADLMKIVGHPKKAALNSLLQRKKFEADDIIEEYARTHNLRNVTAIKLRDLILHHDDEVVTDENLFSPWMERFMDMKSDGTKRIYNETYKKLCVFADMKTLTFDDINKDWLLRFDAWLAKTSPSKNARNIHLRNIRAVFNYAIDEELDIRYPFRKINLRREETKKRALTVEQLRDLFAYPVEDYQVRYLDMFKLIFFLIGINMTDLLHLKDITADGRIEYHRAKTHRLYSIKVEPEAMEIIEKYRGREWLLNPLDTCKSHITYYQHFNKALQKIGDVSFEGTRHVKVVKPVFPKLTSYWARHSWASIAAELDIPKETIAAALGHSIGNPITSIYIDFNMKKVDEANRRVMDWVLYGKK